MSKWTDRALSHPGRVEVLEHLTHKASEASGRQLAGALGMKLGQARYHLGVLCDAALVQKVRSIRERGRADYLYMATARAATR